MSSEDVAISVRNLTKAYRIFGRPADRIRHALSFGKMRRYREFTALQDVSFDLRKGDTLGIIGRNGSGKSTLLQLICGTLRPTSGAVRVHGRVSALLELGAGFHPDFTGRENVYFQGALTGFTKAEMDRRFDGIAAFADIGEFIDQPVRTYSSGMFVRLAFAAAVSVDPEVLVLDEVLAVGDAIFQQKCFDRLTTLQERGTSIIVVSHNPYQIERLCHHAAIMRRGRLSALRPAKETLTLYQELVHEDLAPSSMANEESREGTHDLCFEKVWIENAAGCAVNSVLTTEPVRIIAEVFARKPVDNVRIRFEVCSSNNDVVTMATTIGLTETRWFQGRHRISFLMDPCQLTSGWYYLNAVAVGRSVRLDTWQRVADFKVLLRDKDALNLSSDKGAFVCQGRWELN